MSKILLLCQNKINLIQTVSSICTITVNQYRCKRQQDDIEIRQHPAYINIIVIIILSYSKNINSSFIHLIVIKE